MEKMIKGIFVGAAALSGLYVLSTQGRTGHPGLAQLQGWNYAHRGLHDAEKCENSMSAFRAALEHGYGIEFDIHLIKDGNLAVMHDRSLLRTAGVDVDITTLTTEELDNYQAMIQKAPETNEESPTAAYHIPTGQEGILVYRTKSGDSLIVNPSWNGSLYAGLGSSHTHVYPRYEYEEMKRFDDEDALPYAFLLFYHFILYLSLT